MVATRTANLIAGKHSYFCEIETDEHHHYFVDPPMALKDDLKAMRGSHWCGYDKVPRKAWRVENCRRNNWNLDYLEGKKPYARYTCNMIEEAKRRGIFLPATRTMKRLNETTRRMEEVEVKPYSHQDEMTLFMLVRKWCIVAAEMGTGKTLAAFRAIEHSGVPIVWYVAPKSALAAVQLDARKWGYVHPTVYMTYDELKKRMQNWKAGDVPPRMVVFDESSRLKNASSQRAQAAMHLAEGMRDAHGDNCYIVLMTGSPAPKSPIDWYWQTEIACPGYLKEGDVKKFEYRLAIKEKVSETDGFGYWKHKAWRDGNPNVCKCGNRREAAIHQPANGGSFHTFEVIDNEVEYLYKRMAGLVYVKHKKDCLDLPEMQFRTIHIKPTLDIIRAARLIQAKAPNVITAMTLLRELSDGFQYKDTVIADDICVMCTGNKYLLKDGNPEPCIGCSATGSKRKIEREIVEVASPKLDVLNDLLEENEDIGRLVVYAGFQASVDRICKFVKKQGWEYVRCDGRGWTNSIQPSWDNIRIQEEFQKLTAEPAEKLVFVGHPGSAGMGLTLTAASMEVFLSNDFNGESRIQAMHRIHRAGMDVNRGATIVDLVHLPTDQKLIDNLARKIELQAITMGDIANAIDNYQFTGA